MSGRYVVGRLWLSLLRTRRQIRSETQIWGKNTFKFIGAADNIQCLGNMGCLSHSITTIDLAIPAATEARLPEAFYLLARFASNRKMTYKEKMWEDCHEACGQFRFNWKA